jgi:hypothetical protein
MKSYSPLSAMSCLATWCVLVCALVTGPNAAPTGDLYQSISTALESRGLYLESLPLPRGVLLRNAHTIKEMDSLRSILEARPEPENPWYEFYRGLALSGVSGASADSCFKAALSAAQEDPGLTWVMSAEFQRHHQIAWLDSSLQQLHRQLLAVGSETTPVVAQQLMHFAMLDERSAQDTLSRHLYGWTRTFDHHSVWPVLQVMRMNLTTRPAALFADIAEAARTAWQSWEVQLSVVRLCLEWFSTLVLLFAAAVIVGLALRYSSKALHPAVEWYPASLPSRTRMALLVVMLLSVLALGLLL